jgi:hypothetical protein
MIAFDFILERGHGAIVDDEALEAARNRYPAEVALWTCEAALEKRVAIVEELRNVLRDRVRASVLEGVPQGGAASR